MSSVNYRPLAFHLTSAPQVQWSVSTLHIPLTWPVSNQMYFNTVERLHHHPTAATSSNQTLGLGVKG